MIKAFRTKFYNEIACEFAVPARQSSRKVVVLLSGAPSVPSKRGLMEYFARHGWWVFFPRYRGTWESGGSFLAKSPETDVIDIINEIPKGFKEYWDGTEFVVEPKKIVLIGGSFGGPAAVLASLDPRVSKVVIISGVVDWSKLGPRETFSIFRQYTKNVFEHVYRGRESDWEKLRKGEIYNPLSRIKEIDGKKLLFLHAKDDDSVPYRTVEKFAKATGAKLKLYKKGGHLGLTYILKPSILKHVEKFINEK